MRPETQTKAELRAERDHWKKLAEEGIDPTLKELRLDGGELNMTLAGPAVERMAVLFAEYFIGLGAKNFVEFTIYGRDRSRYTLTMQKVGALSPVDKVRLLEEGVTRAEAKIAAMSGGGETDFRFYLNDILSVCSPKTQAQSGT